MRRASTTPAEDTDATLVSPVIQLTGAVSTLPLASFTVADAVRCVPTSRLAVLGVMAIEAAAGGAVVPLPSPEAEQPSASSPTTKVSAWRPRAKCEHEHRKCTQRLLATTAATGGTESAYSFPPSSTYTTAPFAGSLTITGFPTLPGIPVTRPCHRSTPVPSAKT